MKIKKIITTEYDSHNSIIKKSYQDFIYNNGPYKYFITITSSRDLNEQQLYSKINYLLKVLNRKIYNSKKSKIYLKGFCFIESSSISSRCSKHIHIILKDDIKLDNKMPFEANFMNSINKVKVERNGKYLDESEFSRQCISVKKITDQKHLIEYLTDEFYKDKYGNFIKLIDTSGLVI